MPTFEDETTNITTIAPLSATPQPLATATYTPTPDQKIAQAKQEAANEKERLRMFLLGYI